MKITIAGLVEGVTHRKDKRIMLGIDTQATYLLGGQQLVASVSAEHAQLGTVFMCAHQRPSFARYVATSSLPLTGTCHGRDRTIGPVQLGSGEDIVRL